MIIVLGHQKEIIENLIGENKKIKFIFNEDFKSGMASSIKMGINHLSKSTESFFICLGDMPNISFTIYNQLIKFRNHKDIVVPTYKNQQGNPVLFNKSMKKNILNITGDAKLGAISKMYDYKN